MDTSLIPAILTRIKARYEVEYAWMVIHADEAWHININKNSEDEFDQTRTVASGVDFSELPGFLSSLK